MSSTNKTAIVLVDPYNDFLHPKGKVNHLLAESIAATNTISHLQNLVTIARAQKIPIYYGLHQQVKAGFIAGWEHTTVTQQGQRDSKTFEEGSWGVEIYEGLEPDVEENGDVIVSKHWCSSSFANTDLDYQLKQRDITHLVFAGLTANTCLESTARYAYELGYHITMLKDATAGFNTVVKDAATDLIWPLFANEVLTVEEWKKSL
ncbi:uncharacterized protein EAE98_006735 [Botrytis deweyae]|uniref:Isochorismatase-like domain-containing protein n=1 Tax=Botrytis deweyae TaxID=2478750 RepID=A0ABQ7IIJ9_9HELO|nr:uncharacterized protein EAE98_006735 [Botrytis deweyae]KAF7925510.1 hypothetical protein EAE98_006735 [Botrytis deweyae]